MEHEAERGVRLGQRAVELESAPRRALGLPRCLLPRQVEETEQAEVERQAGPGRRRARREFESLPVERRRAVELGAVSWLDEYWARSSRS
jgi:hypothetical protein